MRKGGRRLTGANVELWAAYAVVSSWTVVETLPVLPHPLPPQEQEEFGLAVYTAVVSGAHWAAFTDGVRSIASCKRNTQEQKYLICRYSHITVSIYLNESIYRMVIILNFLSCTDQFLKWVFKHQGHFSLL